MIVEHAIFFTVSFLIPARVRAAHPVLDVVVDDEVEFFIGEAVVLGKHAVNLVND